MTSSSFRTGASPIAMNTTCPRRATLRFKNYVARFIFLNSNFTFSAAIFLATRRTRVFIACNFKPTTARENFGMRPRIQLLPAARIVIV